MVPNKICILGAVLGKEVNNEHAAALVVVSVANLIGNLPEEKWQQLLKTKLAPCGQSGCKCHEMVGSLIEQLVPFRQFHAAIIEVQKEEGL